MIVSPGGLQKLYMTDQQPISCENFENKAEMIEKVLGKENESFVVKGKKEKI
jgi:hypothetical protein